MSTFTENGVIAFNTEEVENNHAALYFQLVRGCTTHKQLANQILKNARLNNTPNHILDLFLIIANTRDIRHGKGERELSYTLLETCIANFPKFTKQVIEMLPTIYGSWKDIVTLWSRNASNEIGSICVDMFKNQLEQDKNLLEEMDMDVVVVDEATNSGTRLSLCGKWAPREKSQHDKLASLLARELFGQQKAKQQYRKLISRLNRVLNTVEVKMCGKRFREIKPETVPSKALKIYQKAFLNLTSRNTTRRNEEDRLLCAKNFKKAASNDGVKMHGRALFPHELVNTFLHRNVEIDQSNIIQKQWDDIVQSLLEGKPKQEGEENEPFQMKGKYVPLVDVSGSMHGTPMEVAIALGILLSEVAHPSFKDKFITFESNPSWVSLKRCESLQDKVDVTSSAPWGGSTDVIAAIQLLLDTCLAEEIKPEDMPKALFVFSDMQFGMAQDNCDWGRSYLNMVNRFKNAGYPTAPVVIFWNLRGTANFPCKADEEGVIMCSGFSHNLMKLFLEQDIIEEIELKEKRELELQELKKKQQLIEEQKQETAALLAKLKKKSEVMEQDESQPEVEDDFEEVKLMKKMEELQADASAMMVSESMVKLDIEDSSLTPAGMFRKAMDDERYNPIRNLYEQPEIAEEIKLYIG